EPMRRAIHDGLLANNVVGFHTTRWRDSFLASCQEILGSECEREDDVLVYRDRRVYTTSRPISVDPSEFDELAARGEVLEIEREIEARRPEHLIVRVDRTDPSKNIVRGFRAFELYLEAHPEMHRRVGMLALLDPSRQEIPEYAEYLGALQREALRVNDRFVEHGWTPIVLQIADDFPRSVA